MSFGALPEVADVAEDLPAVEPIPLLEAVGIAVEVGVVIGVLLAGVELVDGQAAGLAVEQLGDGAVLDGDHRRVPRRQDVDRLVLALAAAGVVIRAHQLVRRDSRPPGWSSFRAVRSIASGAVDGITPVRPLVGAGTSTTAFGGSSMAVAAGGFAGSASGASGGVARDGGGDRGRGAVPRQRDMLPSEATTNAPSTKPSSPLATRYLKSGRRRSVGVVMRYSAKTTLVPGFTSAASFCASQLVSRTQPCDVVLPTVDGSGVPCSP